ncbi:macro domain-containing protein [Philodulcilactobacillus myokoensis]|uniref:Macro domain-containing protein n=1 Tax=Philodulcilactobacillus myokoensis TaxID=2929573 RepID=A0A9W6B076_9LACO|nr:O-acetyl-ADP-ribose deacetylase [Philodulcilactobacillus myokoensis]GLB46376.1 macro domain-containing protein [Philodulcilactobacillus myokoensis]
MADLKITLGDITKSKVDAIVNAANTGLVGGGGVDGAIHRAAGKAKLDAACRKLGGCPTGEAKTTPGFNLSAQYIIHTAGPIWRDGSFEEDKLLKNCYINSLKQAVAHDCKTVAFPSISTGVYGYPLDRAAKIAVKTIKNFDAPLKVEMVCFDQKTEEAYLKAMK